MNLATRVGGDAAVAPSCASNRGMKERSGAKQLLGEKVSPLYSAATRLSDAGYLQT